METFNDCLDKMKGAANNAFECIALLQKAFSHNSTTPLKDCREKVPSMMKLEAELTHKIARLAQEDNALKKYVSIPRLLSGIEEHIEKLSDIINKKIKDDVLFSDRAISELAILFQRLKELLKNTADLLTTGNPILVQHIRECEQDVVKKALEYATSHEDRLIEGLCLSVASPLFLNMLNSIRCIACNANEIAMKFVQE
jgi:Na+/phosphate symporter